MRTIGEAIEALKKEIQEQGFDPKNVLRYQNLHEDEDIAIFAILFLKNNINDALIEPYLDDLVEKEAGDGEYL